MSPAKSSGDASTSPSAAIARGAAADGSTNPARQRKKSDPSSSNISKGKAGTASSMLPKAADTPQRSGTSVDLPPQVIVKKEIEEEVKEEKAVDVSFLVGLCQEAVGRGVVEMKEVKDLLLMRQLEAEPGGSSGVPQEGVTDALLERALGMCGAVEVGQMHGKRLFARPMKDSVQKHIPPPLLPLLSHFRSLSYPCFIFPLES